MKKLSSLLMAGGVALAIAGLSISAMAGSAQDYIAALDQALSAAPPGGVTPFYSAKASAEALRNQAAAELIAGRDASAAQIAQLALHQLGADGVAGVDTVADLGMVGGGWLSNQPAIPASQPGTPVHMTTAGQAMRFVTE